MSRPVFVLRARWLRAARGVVVARNVSLTASPGDVVAVEGPNGSGKTTLLAAAAGVLPDGRSTVRPGSVGYAPERAGVLPRIALHHWLTGLARTSGLGRDESARRAGDMMGRLGLVPAMTWLCVLAHRVDGRELGRAFAAHVGGRGRAHLATDLGLVPFALVLILAAIAWPLVSQGHHPHPLGLIAQMTGLHLAGALFGAGLGSVLALIERAGYRFLVAVAVFLGMFVVRHTPLTPLLTLAANAATAHTSIAGPAAWLYVPGVVLLTAAALLATRVT
jgi:energy-coupling factor transporter ATP-binding protein EcfA2